MPDQYSGTIRSSAGSTHAYRWRTLSVDRFPSLQEEIDALRHSGQLAQTPAFTNYMNDLGFCLPDNFPSARSLLLIATSAPLMIINGSPTAISPFSCHRTTPSTASPRAMLLEEIRRTIIPGFRSPRGPGRLPFFMKLAAVRSGLAQYGRNNICYVEGMGSFFIPRLPDRSRLRGGSLERSEQSPVLQPLFDLHRCLPDERDQPGSICHRCITVHPAVQ